MYIKSVYLLVHKPRQPPKMKSWVSCLVIITLGGLCNTTKVNQCPGENFPNQDKNFVIGNCVDPPCLAKKNTRIVAKMRFKAESEPKELVKSVYATLSGTNLPFIGVDGTSACDFIYELDEKTKIGNCNLVKGKPYVYIDSVDILPMFPKIRGMVHWSLVDPATGKNILCLEVLLHIVD
ncbi:NPC intracellular cholesterol transporter 2-like [Euwallacea fornicatus]|uniref:NPC intracellular cholesterol transporter 2-like n=1 Tax=Euwallacea fornicatus TaxID=995702 RepID=UPI00338DB580